MKTIWNNMDIKEVENKLIDTCKCLIEGYGRHPIVCFTRRNPKARVRLECDLFTLSGLLELPDEDPGMWNWVLHIERDVVLLTSDNGPEHSSPAHIVIEMLLSECIASHVPNLVDAKRGTEAAADSP
jgi:hypothetical protein